MNCSSVSPRLALLGRSSRGSSARTSARAAEPRGCGRRACSGSRSRDGSRARRAREVFEASGSVDAPCCTAPARPYSSRATLESRRATSKSMRHVAAMVPSAADAAVGGAGLHVIFSMPVDAGPTSAPACSRPCRRGAPRASCFRADLADLAADGDRQPFGCRARMYFGELGARACSSRPAAASRVGLREVDERGGVDVDVVEAGGDRLLDQRLERVATSFSGLRLHTSWGWPGSGRPG